MRISAHLLPLALKPHPSKTLQSYHPSRSAPPEWIPEMTVKLTLPQSLSPCERVRNAAQPRPWDVAATPMQLGLARGCRWLAMLESGGARSITELPAREKSDNS